MVQLYVTLTKSDLFSAGEGPIMIKGISIYNDAFHLINQNKASILLTLKASHQCNMPPYPIKTDQITDLLSTFSNYITTMQSNVTVAQGSELLSTPKSALWVSMRLTSGGGGLTVTGCEVRRGGEGLG